MKYRKDESFESLLMDEPFVAGLINLIGSAILIIAVCGCLVVSILVIGKSQQEQEAQLNQEWNNGICTECNVPYEFKGCVVKTFHRTKYLYECPECFHRIERDHFD